MREAEKMFNIIVQHKRKFRNRIIVQSIILGLGFMCLLYWVNIR